ncbi:metal-dependent transcriptional regulator [Methanobacterium formicicum]|uniref:DtxR family iron (Metal) dependent repressor n=1 Tax=Methanobacterium formicicum TaxID=2162 RepID=A0A089ZVA1_METFO|nr:metal-dependent transcriptional regulator [Methanobacterium formicicum]AIS32074.1 iron-dependent repressor [Methanobacterium formicicum]CEL24694.1 DtxR family iron (metal) dependent repressor [Methanobacterium formicicum]
MSSGNTLSENAEEYMEVLYKLSLKERPVKTTKISTMLNVSPASVTQMIKKLQKEGYVDYSPYKGVTLTEEGYKIASKITRKHRLLERFLHDVLKIKKDKVHDQACEMEHVLSDDAERALCQLLENPDECPDDEELIPVCDFQFETCEECRKRRQEEVKEVGKRDKNLVSITDMKKNEKGKVSFIRGDYKVIRRLMDMGITMGAHIAVLEVAPFKGPIQLLVRGSNLALGRDIAKNVFVEIIREDTVPSKGALSYG